MTVPMHRSSFSSSAALTPSQQQEEQQQPRQRITRELLRNPKTKKHTTTKKTKPYYFNETFVASPHAPSQWIRGVNLGGWLVLERYITPYMFSITDCHIRGELCWFPKQLSAPTTRHGSHGQDESLLCNITKCQPHRIPNVFGQVDYPLDEWTLAEAFDNKTLAAEWLNHHFDRFVSRDDLVALSKNGVTHVRVPLPHFILGSNVDDDTEPWVAADRFHNLVRLLQWCRELGLQVWPDMHTAPGSQNGFDNSGQSKASGSNCQGWSREPEHVQRSLSAIRDITHQIALEGFGDVVTGFGLLNEPFKDCDKQVYDDFVNEGLSIVRQELGVDTHVYISDMFMAKTFNKGFWLDPHQYKNTYLDSHYYHVFEEVSRSLSPRQHIAYVCTKEQRDVTSCCYQDHPRKTQPSKGIHRMVGEWSVAVDTLPVAMLKYMMDAIATTGVAAEFDRQLSPDRQEFLRHFAQAQMVAYESADVGTTAAWFYWNFKMEGGGFAEWDYLRGIKKGWIPQIPSPDIPSAQVFGTCYDILFRTNDTMEVIHEYPDPSLPGLWFGPSIDDDVVVTHGQSLLPRGSRLPIYPVHHHMSPWIWVALAVFAVGVTLRVVGWRRGRKAQYTSIESELSM